MSAASAVRPHPPRSSALVLPSAPVLVPGLTATVSPELRAAQDAVAHAVRDAPRHPHVVLLISGEPGVVLSRHASLRAVGRADLARTVTPAPDLAQRVAHPLGARVHRPPELALSAAVLVLLGAFEQPVMTVQVPPTGTTEHLRRIAEALGAALTRTPALIVAAAGDGAAALAPRAPLLERPEAHDWQTRYAAAATSGDAAALAALGPEDAAALRAVGWAPAVVLDCLARAELTSAPRVRYTGAPHGVGYLVAV